MSKLSLVFLLIVTFVSCSQPSTEDSPSLSRDRGYTKHRTHRVNKVSRDDVDQSREESSTVFIFPVKVSSNDAELILKNGDSNKEIKVTSSLLGDLKVIAAFDGIIDINGNLLSLTGNDLELVVRFNEATYKVSSGDTVTAGQLLGVSKDSLDFSVKDRSELKSLCLNQEEAQDNTIEVYIREKDCS